AVAPDGKTVASGSMSGQICLWDAATGKERLAGRSADMVNLLAFRDGGRTAVLGGGSGGIRDVDPATGKEVRCVTPPWNNGYPVATALTHDGKTMALAVSLDEGGWEIRLWDLLRNGEGTRWPQNARQVTALAFSPDGKVLAAWERGGDISHLVF